MRLATLGCTTPRGPRDARSVIWDTVKDMRVGIYIDGFNLYYGGLSHLGNQAGWKWIDLRVLAARFTNWPGSYVERVVYCTARVNDPENRAQTERQAFYLRALKDHGSADVIEEGYYSSWAKESTMSFERAGHRAPTPLRDPASEFSWSPELRIRRTAEGVMLATVRKREEKGSDVNVATHLLTDVLQGNVDAAIVFSNDSDLALPINVARQHVPVGLVNPQKTKQLAGALRGNRDDGAGRHWWRRLSAEDLAESQLPNQVGAVHKPESW